MNGIVSQSMRQKGTAYRVNFGLTMPLLRRIAGQIPATADVAEMLWQDTGVRESLLLAPMLYPVESFTYDIAQQWLEAIPNTEVADYCCKFLFSQLPFAPQLVAECIVSDNSIKTYTGYRLAYTLFDTENIHEWIEQITISAANYVLLHEDCAAMAARRFLTEGLQHSSVGRIMYNTLQANTQLDDSWRKTLMSLYAEEE